jgi:hypothetical protein
MSWESEHRMRAQSRPNNGTELEADLDCQDVKQSFRVESLQILDNLVSGSKRSADVW